MDSDDAWVVPAAERVYEPAPGAEPSALAGFLEAQRSAFLATCAGLTAEQLVQASVPPSRMSLLGLVRHLTEVERWWFRRQMAGERLPGVYITREDVDADFHGGRAEGARTDFQRYLEEVAAARQAVAGMPPEEPARGRAEVDLRWILLHMVAEYARHNGHADLLRERIDGATGW